MMQESKKFKESAHKVAGNTARRLGWSHAIGYAHRTAGTMGSGGCAILARKGIGIHSPTNSAIPDFCSHRIHLAWVACVAKGGMHCMSIYLIDSVGMNPSNILICEQAALVLRALCGPWICSGDWNLEPDVLAASGFLKLVDGVVFAASLPTCGEKKFDYYVVSKSIAHAVVGMQRIEGVGMEPHYPTRLLIRGDARRFAIRKLVRPTRVPPVLQHGPQPQPPSYQSIYDNLDQVPTRLRDGGPDEQVQSFLDNAMRAWYQAARAEFYTLSSEDLTFKQPRFTLACAAKGIASQWSGTTAVSSSWRGLAKRATESANTVSRQAVDTAQFRILQSHLRFLPRAAELIPKRDRLQHSGATFKFAKSFLAAVDARSSHWLCSLACLAKKKAADLEAATASMRKNFWRQMIGAAPEPGQTKKPRPTKAAYRYIRGSEGWTPSPIGKIEFQDGIPDDPQDNIPTTNLTDLSTTTLLPLSLNPFHLRHSAIRPGQR